LSPYNSYLCLLFDSSMKSHQERINSYLRYIVLAVIISAFFSSCENDKDEQQYDYLVSSQKVKTINVELARSVFNLISSVYPEVQDFIDSAVYDVHVYKVVYKTIFKGSELNASGIICLPDAEGNFPLLSFQNGTNTLHSNAPSVNLLNTMFTALQSMSSLGYIILMSDYLGFGESTQILHPYYHRESNDAAVVDLIHASEEFFIHEQVKALDDGSLFLMGYSQGGWATLSALHALENDQLLTKDILAASCGAGAYDVIEVAKYIFQLDEYPAPFYLPYFVESHIRNGFLDEELQKYFNEPYASLIPGLFDGSKSGGAINAELTDSVQLLVTPGLRENLENGDDFISLRNELSVNSVEAWPSETKLMFFHGGKDDNVPSFESYHIFEAFIQQGLDPSQVQLITVDSLDHDTGLIPWVLSTITSFNELKYSAR
jgi:pimeloyl-ACP methyl ester carboxylesterase